MESVGERAKRARRAGRLDGALRFEVERVVPGAADDPQSRHGAVAVDDEGEIRVERNAGLRGREAHPNLAHEVVEVPRKREFEPDDSHVGDVMPLGSGGTRTAASA